MSDGLLGDLPATGGRHDFGTTEVAEPECADCGTKGSLTYYPADDEHACPPCSNGGLEPGIPWYDAEARPIDDFRRGIEKIRQIPVDLLDSGKMDGAITDVINRTRREITKALGVPKEIMNPMTDEGRALVEKYRGPRDKAAEMAEVYGMSPAKYGRTQIALSFHAQESFVASRCFPRISVAPQTNS